MKTLESNVDGVRLIGPESTEFEAAFEPLLGRAPRALLAPAIPFSVIVANDMDRTIALLGVRFDMTGPRGKPYSVIHYADTLRNPEKADFLAGTKRFVCAEPGYTSLLLQREGEPSTRGRTNLDSLRKMLDIRASLDCVAFDDGRFDGPDTLNAFVRLAEQRELEAAFAQMIVTVGTSEAEKLLQNAAEDPEERARRTLARKLLQGLQTGGHEEMLTRARNHRLKMPVWRQPQGYAHSMGTGLC